MELIQREVRGKVIADHGIILHGGACAILRAAGSARELEGLAAKVEEITFLSCMVRLCQI
jgi:hypothetical protein